MSMMRSFFSDSDAFATRVDRQVEPFVARVLGLTQGAGGLNLRIASVTLTPCGPAPTCWPSGGLRGDRHPYADPIRLVISTCSHFFPPPELSESPRVMATDALVITYQQLM